MSYNDFIKLVERNATIGRWDDYYNELVNKRLLIKTKRRGLEDFINELGQGVPVKEWKRRGVNNLLLSQMFSFIRRDLVKIPSDFFEINISFIVIFCPGEIVERIKIDNWKDAEQKNVLRSYFGDKDFLEVTVGESLEYDYEYGYDYPDYVKTRFEIMERIKKFRNYLALRSDRMKVSNQSFDDPRYFFSTGERQIHEYENILNHMDIDGRLVFIGDGYGVGAMISVLNNWDYLSVEANGIGRMSMEIGIVNDFSYGLSNARNGDILVFFNVEEYLTDEEVRRYSEYSKVISVNENRVSRLCSESLTRTHGKVWVKGVEFVDFDLRPIVEVDRYLKDREPVVPTDVKSTIYAKSIGVKIADDGLKISYGEKEGCFDIRSRGWPSNLDRAHEGEVKILRGFKFEYRNFGQMVQVPGEVFKYYPVEPGKIAILKKGMYWEDGEYFVAEIDNGNRIRFIEIDEGVVIPVYYLYTVMRGRKESYFRQNNVGVGYAVKGSEVIDNG